LRWLRPEHPDLDEARQCLSAIVNDGKRVGDIVARVSALIKRVAPRQDPLDINEIILEVVALTRGEMNRNGISQQIQLTTGLPVIHADRVQLQQVLLNLILNAMEAMTEVGERELLIKTDTDAAKCVIVEVRDTGLGVPPDRLVHLFDPFYTTKPSGTGMGLSICRSIVEAHGGRLWAKANKPRGAIFEFTVPGHSKTAS
jgi:signal transduction histidine kinase